MQKMNNKEFRSTGKFLPARPDDGNQTSTDHADHAIQNLGLTHFDRFKISD
jgi:hypothetical protein